MISKGQCIKSDYYSKASFLHNITLRAERERSAVAETIGFQPFWWNNWG